MFQFYFIVQIATILCAPLPILAMEIDHNSIGVMELCTLGLFLIAALTLIVQQNTARRERMEQHVENAGKLNALLDFQKAQTEVNAKRDLQVGELRTQTATLLEISHGMNRRLEMIEDRNNNWRDRNQSS